MNREMQARIRDHKQEAVELIRFANPNSKMMIPDSRVIEIISRHIPYAAERPTIERFVVVEHGKNPIIEHARYQVDLSDGRSYHIDAYNNLKGRSPEQIAEDKNADFPSGLFTIFHTEIK